MRIGIDLGGSKIEGIVMDAGNQVVVSKRIKTPSAQGYAAILKATRDLVSFLENRVNRRCVVGIGTPGALSHDRGTLKNSNTVCMNGRTIKLDLEKLLHRKIRLENDANCFALSEASDGAAKECRVVFGVIIGTGVGGGVVIDKQLHIGPQHIAGEWGHNVLIPQGRDCYCNNKGCVETYLSGPGLSREWREQSGSEEELAAKTIARLAANGDAVCQSVLNRYFSYFGLAIATVINILDPDAIVLGGGMSNLGGLYTMGVEYAGRHVFNEELKTPILMNKYGDSSGVRGAAQLWPAAAGGT